MSKVNSLYEYQFYNRSTRVDDAVFGVGAAHRVKQIHSNKVIEVDEGQTGWTDADALITHIVDLPIGVITADCAPVLFYADGVVGAAHAGWRGAVDGVLDNTVKAMADDPSSIHAVIGPCISQSSYEVSQGFEKPFMDHNPMAEKFFIPGSAGKLHFDLAGYCAFRLAICGVKHIQIEGTDTLTHTDYHSHRGGAGGSDRNLSAIILKG